MNKVIEINKDDERYPKNLKEIYNPPEKLYCLGNLELLNSLSIAIIGCRRASKYGLKIAEIFSDKLSKSGVTIVSGLAKGIDAQAHKGSLNNIGRTIAVIGSGLDVIYPKENEQLYKEILINNGLIVSIYPIGTKPQRENFPKRNRIISALSSGVLVVEAKKRSGTMITVDFALEQGKNVYAIPGNIDSLNSVGTNDLIKQGAKIVTNYKEVLEDLSTL